MASTNDSSIASVIWAAQPLVTFRQSLIMWLLLAHSRQRPPSICCWRSWGVSLPSFPSLSVKSGFFCTCSLDLFLSLEPDALLASSGLGDLFPNFLLVQGAGPFSRASLALCSQYLWLILSTKSLSSWSMEGWLKLAILSLTLFRSAEYTFQRSTLSL